MNWVLSIGGLALVLIPLVDVLRSVLSTRGGGPLTTLVTVGCWKGSRLHFRLTRNRSILEANGLITLIMIFAMWVVPMWLGWTAVFSAADGVIFHQLTGEEATGWDRAYFAGMVFLTLGTGDMLAEGAGWRLVSVLASFNGLVIITLTITYLLSVIAAEIDKRKLAMRVNSLGESPVEIVENGWTGDDFESLEEQLVDVSADLMHQAERHVAYPLLQYFYSANKQVSLSRSLAKLEDTLTLLRDCVDESVRPDALRLQMLCDALQAYCDRIESAHLTPVENPPPLPDVSTLREQGIVACDDGAVAQAFERRESRRRILGQLLESNGWCWPTGHREE